MAKIEHKGTIIKKGGIEDQIIKSSTLLLTLFIIVEIIYFFTFITQIQLTVSVVLLALIRIAIEVFIAYIIFLLLRAVAEVIIILKVKNNLPTAHEPTKPIDIIQADYMSCSNCQAEVSYVSYNQRKCQSCRETLESC
ncbi:MAG: hypothetical protein HRT88_05955 [Lentisphaeraceae bacterium]|nr:hypothetical protein [Lentisphaeraceae bacterium]